MLCGVGFGFFQTPNMKAIMSSAPANRSGGASGILAASRLFGQSVGAAIVAICLSLSPHQGIWAAIWVGAAVGVLGSAVSFSPAPPRRARAPRRPRFGQSHRASTNASSAPAHCATTNGGTPDGAMPAKVFDSDRASVTAGLANDVEAVNQYAAVM